MPDISEKELKKEIAKILKNDKKAAPKKVRRKLEDILDTDLSEKKKLIEKLVSEYLKKDDEDDDDEKSEDDDDDEDVGKKRSGKRSAPASKGSLKKAHKESSDEEAEDGTNDSESEDDKKKKKKDSDSDSDDDEELSSAKKKKELSKEDLKDEIAKVLENANLSKTSSKKVRQTLEKKLGVDLSDKKKLIDQLVLDYVSKKGGASDGDEEDDKKKDSDGGSDKEKSNSKKQADLSKEEEELKVEIAKILKNANLAKTSTKKVRQQLEKKMGVDLLDKRKLIDRLVMDYVTEKGGDSDDDEDEEEEKPPKKKKKGSDDNDSDWGKGKAKKAPKAKKGGRGKGGGYTRAYKLSPALAELMGAEEMPRHEVVRRVWDIIKTKQLYDPNNRQFAICDHALYKVFGTTRFRTFGMMKYLKNHFLDD